MSVRRVVALGTLAFLLSLAGLLRAPAAGASGLLGPIAGLAASVEWVRFDRALSEGRTDLAYRRAERALALDPASTEGWSFFASHLIYDRGSAEVEPDPARRREWIAAGLAVLERGERSAREPARLVLYRAIVHTGLAEAEDATEAERALHEDRARALYARAAELGLDLAAEIAESLEHRHDHDH